MNIRHRAYAYVTNAHRLLLFTHPEAPEAGLQVPAGTVGPGEDPQDTVVREATEETGLVDLRLESFLIQDTRNMNDYGTNELQYRWVLSSLLGGHPEGNLASRRIRGRWDTGHSVRFFWAEITAIPKLVADYGDHIDLLVDSLATRESL